MASRLLSPSDPRFGGVGVVSGRRTDEEALLAAGEVRAAGSPRPRGTASAGQVDHRHRPGKVRGIPCFNRNSAIGKWGKTPRTCPPDCRYVEGISWKPILVAPGVYQLPS
ncbi:endonuclease domain-containing protein [Streptomyces sp. NPDC006184]|uniref:endonuclease domain-containing protein n=1 Tax=unclassified Streptomyces TaxID=2593676 RepID=UPI0033BD053B